MIDDPKRRYVWNKTNTILVDEKAKSRFWRV
jgi:hypothetical protein